MKFGVLGPLEIANDLGAIELQGAKRSVVLAVLLCRPNRPVGMDLLSDCLWPRSRPASAEDNVRGYVHQLRRALGSDRLTHSPGGYQLTVRDGELDADRFRTLAADGQRALIEGDPVRAAELLHQAMELWRGPALAGLPDVAMLRDEAAMLEEYRLHVLEDRIAADVEVWGHAGDGRPAGGGLVAEIIGHISVHPLRERLRAQLMLALYRSGRQADALQAYDDLRERLVTELGIEPGPELRRLQHAILTSDPAVDVPDRSRQPALLGSIAGRQSERGSGTDPLRRCAQLPADVRCFTGRSDYLRQLDYLASRSEDGRTRGRLPLALITGTAGVGKTALAVHWAHRASGLFADGQLYINLHGYSTGTPVRPEHALTQLLQALGVHQADIPADPDQAAAEFRSRVAGLRLLIVLDDARSSEQVRLLLPGSATCMVLVTSRNRLAGLVARDGARPLKVAPFSDREAARLIGRLVGIEGTAAERGAIIELAKLCAGLPLALRIAAARFADSRAGSLASDVRQLAGADPMTALIADSDDPQASVCATFDSSYRELGDAERRMFRMLSLASGPDISVEAAATLAGVPRPAAAVLLDRLSAACLLDEPLPGRYQLHELLRLFARRHAADQDSEPDRHAAVDRLAAWYLGRAQVAADALYPHLLRLPIVAAPAETSTSVTAAQAVSQAAALGWLDAERRNLVATIVDCAEHGPLPVAYRLADVLRGYLANRRYITDWMVSGRAALAAADKDGAADAQVAARLNLGHMEWCLGRYHAARDHYRGALRSARQAGWTQAQATLLGNLGLVHREAGEPTLAVRYLRLAIALDRRAVRSDGEANNLVNLGYVLAQLGRLDEARQSCERGLALFRASGAQAGEAHALANLGTVLRDLGKFEEAGWHLRAALAIYRDVGDRSNEADTINSLATLGREAGDYTTALELATRALKLAAGAGDRRAQADCLLTAASINQRILRYHQAMRQDRKALRLAGATGTRYQQARARQGLVVAHQSLNERPAS